MYIKLDNLVISKNMILPNSYSATPKNVYSKAERSRGKSLKMIKVLLGSVYEIKVTLDHMKLRKDFVSQLRQTIMKPEINVEFYDDYSSSQKVQNCYCQDTEMKLRLIRGDDFRYEDISLVFTANQAANWINN